MKKVMIVGASAWQVPMIEKAKELGYTVAVVDYNPNAVGIAHAHAYYNASTIDPEGVCAAAKAFGADGITTVATDMPMRAIAYTCEQLGLTGLTSQVAVRATDKAEMIRAFAAHNVPHPWFYVVEDGLAAVREKLTFPCICKPTDNSASRGVVIVENEAQLESAVAYSSENGRSGAVIVEELLRGSEISVEAFAVGGEVYVLAVTDKITTGSPHFVEMGHNQPSHFVAEPVYEQIKAATAAAIKAVGLENGPAHVEMMITSRGPVLIEMGARLGGDFITTDLVPLSTGIDMLAATIRLACGETVDLQPKVQKAAAIRYMKTESGIIRAVRGLEEAEKLPHMIRAAMLKPVGEAAGEITNSLDRVGYVIAQADTVAAAAAACENALKTVKITVE